MSVESTFINLLKNFASIRANQKPEGVNKAIVYKLISHVPKKTVNGVTYASRQRFQFSCYGESLDESSGLAINVITVLDGIENSGDIKLAQFLNRNYYLDSETNLFCNSVDFMIW